VSVPRLTPRSSRALILADRGARAKRWRIKADDREASTRRMALGGGDCWCGAPGGHSWPGRDDGAPHPRDWPGRVNGHPFREAAR